MTQSFRQPTLSMPPYLSTSQEAISRSLNSDLKPGFLMDASMADASANENGKAPQDDEFLFYDSDDCSEADSEMTDSDSDDDSDDDSDSEDESSDSDSDESLDHGDDGEDDNDKELIQSLTNLRAGMQRVRSANSMRSMMSAASLGPGAQSANSVKRRMLEKSRKRIAGDENDKRGQLKQCVSIGNMQALAAEAMKRSDGASQNCYDQRQVLRECASIGHIGKMVSAQETQVNDGAIKPDEHLQNLLGGNTPQTFRYDALDGFFLEPTPEYVEAWTNELTKAVRSHDLKTLQQMHKQGQRLQAANQFGESIVHLCVRRGTPEILRFLIQDAGVCLRVCCENGRTPLHDAAWSLTNNPNSYTIMMQVLAESPMQLFITDKRGFTPLSYVPRARWAECNAFLDKQYAKGRLAALTQAK